MKKEQQIFNNKKSTFFKLLAMLVTGLAIWIIYAEVKGRRHLSGVRPEEKAYVPDVEIETGAKDTAPESSEQLDNLEKELTEHVNSEKSEKHSTPVLPETILDPYRLHLIQVMRLAEKFSSREDYLKELEFLLQNNRKYSSEISDILTLLAEYRNKYLTSEDREYKKLSFDGGLATRIMNKIIHVEQKNPDHQKQTEDYKIIKSKIHMMEEYFYSKEFLKRYLQ